ncbi:U-box domain-containing protein 35-like isoform X2 [Andrographis paniculata]|uniref:U-box domain-containing protein 35-like isoform X2 n=1 Tax=Andrographis paniculata TaxID=175694 RepID=UPI0021E804A4|nr:U-box domain-containing protein 35-like isoform X2 [Andrographis paniculata]
MWLSSGRTSSNVGRKTGRNGLVAIAIDKDKGSQHALRWATDNLISKGHTVILIHVIHRSPQSKRNNYDINNPDGGNFVNAQQFDSRTKELLLTFHCFCTRKDIHCFDVVLEDTDIARAITDYVAHAAIENLVLGTSHRGFIRRFKMVDLPGSVSKAAPDFCTVYVISKTKISSVRNAARQAPFDSPLTPQIQKIEETGNGNTSPPKVLSKRTSNIQGGGGQRLSHRTTIDDTELVKSPFSRGRGGPTGKMFADLSETDSDISFISSERPSTDSRISTDRMSGMLFDTMDSSRMSTSSTSSFGSIFSSNRGSNYSSFTDKSSSSFESDDVEAEMRRLKLELQKTMEMYSTACKEALTAKQKTVELNRWRMEEERRVEEARLAEEEEISVENAKAAPMAVSSLRCRIYTIDEIEEATECFSESHKIGEGGYGPVYKCYLDHTRVAVKILRPDAAQGREQFQREVEVLSCLRHPNMVLLLGACPEYGCLVYEYMAKGSLEDCLRGKGNTLALSWQLRFRIAAEIATGLHFLHQTKPEPLVHRDLKPANILLDQNYVSKIGDVGLARLVPPSVADDVTQYRMTSAAGTFCYIDPEYQQTGMLGVKSDVYSLGVVFLQILTAKSAMGLTHHVARAIDHGNFAEMLDPAVPDWPVEEALSFAKMAVKCTELRRKDRPDLGKVILPELNRLRDFGEEDMKFLVDPSFSSTHKETQRSDHSDRSKDIDPQGNTSLASIPENTTEATE